MGIPPDPPDPEGQVKVRERIRREDINEDSLRELIDACEPGDMLRIGYDYRKVVHRLLDRHIKVRGRCPMGCGDTLFLGSGGYVTCSWHECPKPDAASDFLSGEAP